MSLWAQRHFRIVTLLLGMCVFAWPGASRAEGNQPFPFSVLIELGGGYHFSTANAADTDSSGTYTKKFKSGYETSLHIGTLIGPGFFVGAVYEYWSASRKVAFSGVEQTDILNYHSAGGEVGWLLQHNSRLFYLLTATAFYPMAAEVKSTSHASAFKAEKEISYRGRLALGFKLYQRVSLLLEGGYRWANLKGLSAEGTPFLPGNAEFRLSGPFVGAGLGIHL